MSQKKENGVYLHSYVSMRTGTRGNPKFEIRNPKFELRNPKFEIRNPKFEIRNPKFELHLPTFPLSHFLTFFLFIASALGTTYDMSALSFSRLTNASNVIVLGEVGYPPKVHGNGSTTTVIVREVLKGEGQVSLGQEIKIVTLGRGQIRAPKGERVLLYLNRVRNSDPKSEIVYTLAFEGFGAVPLPSDNRQPSADGSVKSESEEIISAARKYVSLFSLSVAQPARLGGQTGGLSNIGRYKDVLVECANSRNPRVCVSACVDIIRNPKIAEALCESDSDVDVLITRFTRSRDAGARDYLARALGATRSSRAVPALIDSLSIRASKEFNAKAQRRRGAEKAQIRNKGFMGKEAQGIYGKGKSYQSPITTASVARALKSIGDPTTVTQLVRKLRQSKDDTSGRVAIVNTIGALGGDMATRSLFRRIRDKDKRVRLAAALALAKVNPTEAVASFSRILRASERPRARGMERQRDPDMQKLAIVTLARMASGGKKLRANLAKVSNLRKDNREAKRILEEFSENHKNEDIGAFAAQALNWRQLWK